MDDIIDLDEDNKQIKVEVGLSEIDKMLMKQAMKDMDANMTGPQIVKGRKFEGAGFAGNPDKIIFKDFTVGFAVEKTIEITNISLGFNSFKLLPLEDEIIDFFEITYKPCGRIPAGISTQIKIKFTPMVDKDYYSNLKLLSETGLCLIPIECLYKKCLITIENPIITLGDVILGQEVKFQLNIENKGALSCDFKIMNRTEEEFIPIEEEEEANLTDDIRQYAEYTESNIIKEKQYYIETHNKILNDEIEAIKRAHEEDQNSALAMEIYLRKIEEDNLKREQEQLQQEEQLILDKIQGKDKNKPTNKKKSNTKMAYVKQEEEQEKPNTYNLNEELSKISLETNKKLVELSNNCILKQIRFPLKGIINEFSKKKVSFNILAKYIGNFDETLTFKVIFGKQIQIFKVQLLYNIIDFPIIPNKKLFCLDYLIEGNVFREKIVLQNTSHLSYKVQIYQHRSLNKIIEINPDLGYIQPNSSFEIWLKFDIIRDELAKLHPFFRNNSLVQTKQSSVALENIDGVEFNLPLKIVIANIGLPIILTVRFCSTNDNIIINPLFLEYNKVFIDESKTIDITIENKSLLSQKFGFIMLPKEFELTPSIGTINSGEKLIIKCNYQSFDNNIGHREGEIYCKITTNELTVKNIKIKYHIEIINSDVKIIPKNIIFQSLPEKEKAVKIITLYNNTSYDVTCEFLTPLYFLCGIKIMPKVFQINSNKFTTCVLEYESDFRPYNAFSINLIKENLIKLREMNLIDFECYPEMVELYEQACNSSNYEINPILENKIREEFNSIINKIYDQDKSKKGKKEDAKDKKEVKKDKKQLEEEEKRKKEEEEKRIEKEEIEKNERINEFTKDIRDNELALFGIEKHSFGPNVNDFKKDSLEYYDNDIYQNEIKSEHNRILIPLAYKKITNSDKLINQPKLQMTYIEVNTITTERDIIFDKTEINFGEVSVKTRKIVNLGIYNKTNKKMNINIKSLIVSNCFSLVNSVREIPPKSSFNFIVDFVPQMDIPYFDELVFVTDKTQASIKLSGKGVSPEVEVNIDKGIMFMGNSCIGNPIEKVFEIRNKSNFPVDFEIISLISGKKNRNNIKPFTFIPYKGLLKGEEKKEIKVIFYGDHLEFVNYFEYALIEVANQKKPNYIFFSGCSWTRQIYTRKYFSPLFYDLDSLKKREFNQDILKDAYDVQIKQEPIVLIFKKITGVDSIDNNILSEKAFKRKIIIGNCRLKDPKLEKNSNYEILMPKDDIYFSCDNLKGTINSGSESIATFTFKKPQLDPLLGNITELKGIGMWITAKAEIRLTGGFVNPGQNDLTIIDIVLKAYVDQL